MAASVEYVLSQLLRWTSSDSEELSDAVLLERFVQRRDEPLAGSVLKGMFLTKLVGAMTMALTLTVAASVTVALVYRGATTETPEDKPSPAGAAKPSDDQKPQARTDALGDPLPEGAIARLGTLRLRNSRGPVVFSPDGKYIVAAGGDSGTEAVFWDRGSGRRVKALTVKGNIFRLAFSPDGKQLAAVGNGGFFNPVWDAASGKELYTFKGYEVAFRAAGKELISTYSSVTETTVRTYDTATGRRLTKWTFAYPSQINFALSPDGRFAAVPLQEAEGGTVAIFDLSKRAEVKRLRFPQGKHAPLHFSGDGLRLVVADPKGFSVWDWSSGKALLHWAGRIRNPPAFSSDSRRLVWSGTEEEGVDSLWLSEVEAGKPRSVRSLTSDNFNYPTAFSRDGKCVAFVTEGNAVIVLDARTGRDMLPLDAHDGRIWSVAYSSDSRHVITRDSSRVLVWEAATGRLIRRLPDDLPKGETILLNTAAHGRIVTVVLADGTLHLRDLATAKVLRQLKGKDGYYFDRVGDVSALSPDGRFAAILNLDGIRIYDLDTGEIRCQFTRDHPIWGMHFSADGRTLIVTIQDFQKGLLPHYHDARTGRKVEAPADAGARKKQGGRWREDSEEAKARLQGLKLLDAKGRLAFVGQDVFITGVYESPGGKYLAVEGRTGLPYVIDETNKGFLYVWDTATRRLVLNLEGPEGGTNIAGFSADGRTLISTSHWPGTIHLWEIATGRERLRLAGHKYGDVRIGFRPDGRVLVSGAADTQAFLWDLTGRSPDGVRRQTRHSPERLRQLWDTLARDDAVEAYRSMWELVDAPTQTAAWMREHLPPIKSVEGRQIERLIVDLDSDEFAVRSKASEELERLGEMAEPALRAELRAKPTLECRRRCEELLAKLSVLSSRRLRAVRAVEALELAGTEEAREMLKALAAGAKGARLTEEAKAALERLASRERHGSP